MKATVLEDLFVWSVYQPERRIDFNGFFWNRCGGVLIDPMPLDQDGLAFVRGEGGARWIVLTNSDHVRAARELAREFGAQIVAPACDRAALGHVEVAAWFGVEDPLPTELAERIDVRWIRGGKTEAEAVLYLASIRAVVFGDAVRSHVSGELRLLPEPKVRDAATLEADVAALADLKIAAVLLGDGDCLFTGASAAFAALARTLD